MNNSNYNDIDISDTHNEDEGNDIVHDLGQEIESPQIYQQRKKSSSQTNNRSMNIVMTPNQVKVTANIDPHMELSPYDSDVAASAHEFAKHVSICNIDFKENILRKMQAIKLNDTTQLNLKVDELKK